MTCPKCNSKEVPKVIDINLSFLYIDVFECGSSIDPLELGRYTGIFSDPLFTQSDKCKSIVRDIKLNELVNG